MSKISYNDRNWKKYKLIKIKIKKINLHKSKVKKY